LIEEFVPARLVGGKMGGRLRSHIIGGFVLQNVLKHVEKG
jgi:hypothetical protein